jgi:segregation and condensation protein B
MASLKAELLAVLFAAGRPVALKELSPLGHPEEALLRALSALEKELSGGEMGIALERVAGGGGSWCTKRPWRRWKGF